MPHRTVIKPEFGDAVKAALGGLSISQASYKTQISYEYIRKMGYGHIPSPDIIRRFAHGMGIDLRSDCGGKGAAGNAGFWCIRKGVFPRSHV